MSTSGGTGSGYASMLSWRKPAKPTMRMNGSAIAINVRCFSAKAMIAFTSMRAWPQSPGLRGAIDEQAAARHDFFTCLEAFQHLDHAVVDPAGADRPKGQIVVAPHDPDTGRLAFAHDRLLGHGNGIRLAARDDAEAGKHLGFE